MNIEEISTIVNTESLRESDMSPDALTLFRALKDLIPIFNENALLYSDLKRKFSRRYLNHPKLEISPSLTFEVHNNNNNLKDHLVQLAKQLKQYKAQSESSKEDSELTIQQLNNEIRDLREQVFNYENLIGILQCNKSSESEQYNFTISNAPSHT